MKNVKFNIFIFPIIIFLCMFSFLFIPGLFVSSEIGIGIVVLLLPLYFAIPFLIIAQLVWSFLNKHNLFYALCLCLIGFFIPNILFLSNDYYFNLFDCLFYDNKYITIYILICTIVYVVKRLYEWLKDFIINKKRRTK
ncbi:hypothetical protein QOZ84_02035 [Romboutsia sedimentorum]|uniref:Uncharacterized protein n=1 Tax=Romboutsia sedimentorum TaxID=1368474 RepID=A0ABT7E8B2_9FIRM|nr:hypothetical protein [Romboutsia sedimentorum]MDK2562313.1 hypothetical protein [Romboutsia sedimentorum]